MNKIDGKVLIYTKKIATCKACKEKVSNAGYNVEYLCAKDKMNKTQKDLRKYLIENELLPHASEYYVGLKQDIEEYSHYLEKNFKYEK